MHPPRRPLFDWRLRGQCELCRTWSVDALCRACAERFAAPVARCARCALALPAPGDADCRACATAAPPFSRCVAVGDYAYPWSELIGAFKYRGRVDLAGLLARALVQALERSGRGDAELVMPVPLSAARLRERGFNQAWELARRVAAAYRLPADAHRLQRLRDTPHQVGLTRAERARNLQHAMYLAPADQSRLQGRHVALVDDVLTTGATADAATRALRAAGAASVQVWVVARTPAGPSENG